MTSYGFKKDVATAVCAPVARVATVATKAVAVAFVAVVVAMVRGVWWLATDPKGRWVCARTWWCVRHPRQSLAWGWAHLRYRLALVRRAVAK